MGWTDSHLHAFTIGGKRYGGAPSTTGSPQEDLDEKKFTLAKAIGRDRQFRYEYDFGDDWQHQVVVRDAFEGTIGLTYAVCLEGERSCPPEEPEAASLRIRKHAGGGLRSQARRVRRVHRMAGRGLRPRGVQPGHHQRHSANDLSNPQTAGASRDEPEVHLGAHGASCPVDGGSTPFIRTITAVHDLPETHRCSAVGRAPRTRSDA